MRTTAVALLGLAASATAFHVPMAPKASPTKVYAGADGATQYSKSLPFLPQPKQLNGLVGNAGFDPLALSEYIDVKWMVEAEIKHCRVAMLAVLGVLVQNLVHLPGDLYSEPNHIKAFFQVGPQPSLQIFLFCGALESILNNGKMTALDMFTDPNRKPGDLGFDPLKLGKDPAKKERYQLSEIKNGRLAMLAIGGLFHQVLVTGHPLF